MFLNVFSICTSLSTFLTTVAVLNKCQNSTDHIFENKTSISSSPTLSLIPSSLKSDHQNHHNTVIQQTQYSPHQPLLLRTILPILFLLYHLYQLFLPQIQHFTQCKISTPKQLKQTTTITHSLQYQHKHRQSF